MHPLVSNPLRLPLGVGIISSVGPVAEKRRELTKVSSQISS